MMRYFLVVFFSIFAFNLSGLSQISYFDGDPIWRVHQAHSPDLYQVFYTEYIYFLNGDSVINDTLYHKLFSHTWNDNEVIGDEFEGLIRQENKKVYTRNINYADDNSEFLLYDFGLNVGDTLPSTHLYSQNSVFPSIVESIDSLLIDGQYHRIITSNDLDAVMLEGVGHHQGFYNEGMYIPFDYTYNLSCYTKNGEQIVFPNSALPYWNENNDVCDYTLSVSETQKPIFQIYPNPTKDILTIHSDTRIQSVSIYNLLGAEVLKSDGSGLQMNLSVSDLPKGVYALNVSLENGEILVQQFIKE